MPAGHLLKVIHKKHIDNAAACRPHDWNCFGRDLLGNDDVKRLFLGEIPESLKALNFTDA